MFTFLQNDLLRRGIVVRL